MWSAGRSRHGAAGRRNSPTRTHALTDATPPSSQASHLLMVLLHNLIGRIDAAIPRILELTLARLQVPTSEHVKTGDQLKSALLQVKINLNLI